MKSFGQRPSGERLERLRASPSFDGTAFRNLHPIPPGLRDLSAPRPTLRDAAAKGDAKKHGLRIHATPSQHFSGRGLKDRNATLWSSLVIESPRHRVFFSGDTGLTGEYTAVQERFGRFDLVMLEVGAFHPSWGDIHLGPANALKAWSLLGSGAFLPVHWGTFSLALHDWDEPVETLLRLGPQHGAPLLLPKLGEPVEPEHGPKAIPWWRDMTAAMPKALPWPLD